MIDTKYTERFFYENGTIWHSGGIACVAPDFCKGTTIDPDLYGPIFAEAGTVASETGLSPRELAEQREELLGACQVALKNGDNCLGEETKALLRAAIKKANGEPVVAV